MDPVAVQAARDSTEIILQYGIGGVFLLSSIAVNVIQYRQVVSLTNQLQKAFEARLADAKEATTALNRASTAIDGNTDGMKGVEDAITKFAAVIDARRR